MEQNSQTRLYAALGVAGQVGCLAVFLALGALLLGLWLDQTFNTRRVLVLICVLGSIPLNLFITLRIAQRLVARVIPPAKPKTEPVRHTGTDDE